MGRLKGRKKEQGVTLVELMIVVAILGMVMAAMYNMFEFQQRSYTTQDNVAVMQQNVRVGLEYMVKEIRMAGYIPEGIPPNSTAPDTDPIFVATANGITFLADIDDDGTTERVQYLVDFDAGENTTDLKREIFYWSDPDWFDEDGEAAQIVADNIDTIDFTYFLTADRNGVEAEDNDIDDDGDGQTDELGELLTWDFGADGDLDTSLLRGYIRKIRLTMTARAPNPDSKYIHPTQGDHYRRRTLSSNISLRNMQ